MFNSRPPDGSSEREKETQMKKIPYCLAAALLCGIAGKSFSQSKTETLQAPPSKIVIDGDLKDWGDSLRYYNTEKKINYAIANTRDTLYMAIRINDRSEQTRILRAGLTFSIDPKGKKKETYSITFPLNVQGNSSAAVSHMSDAPAISASRTGMNCFANGSLPCAV